MELGGIAVEFDDIDLTYSGDNVTDVLLYNKGNLVKSVELVWSGTQVTDIYISYPNQYLTDHISLSYTDDKVTGISKIKEIV